ncbi:hypothetical protein pdam_00024980 [Pocillopora damicornis]|uniref:Uncharacterized protein n=1 Tax=Pocillopora damicornis TaxID=46731 RepID=A0A3M6UQZ0_POCDA|nr:hypothetical protein pdam_00024980 [Pocillopora damicornis]
MPLFAELNPQFLISTLIYGYPVTKKMHRFGLNIGQIYNAPGVSRTITWLVSMIIDLHLRLPYLSHKLIWFNDNMNHFMMQFSDDGALRQVT